MENQPLNLFERFNQWITESIMVKLFSIGFLTLILLIPASWIEELIQERQSRANEAILEVSDKWSGQQTITGPVLMIPFTKIEKSRRWSDGKQLEELIESVHQAYFLPEGYQVKCTVSPEVLHRGIFDVAVYKSEISMQATFALPDFSTWSIPDSQVHWKEAVLINGITDLRGISENPVIKIGDKQLYSNATSDIGLILIPEEETNPRLVQSGVVTTLGWSTRMDAVSDFSIQLSLKGSERLYFLPTGQSTVIQTDGQWPSPSFEGKFLPESRTIHESGFTATWKVLSFNRPFAPQWIDKEQSLAGSEFGVRLLIPADQYQKSTRTAKYGQLIILLAFTVLFLLEVTTKIKIHPFQYILIGAALILYYTLLLSISEQVGYNTAYMIASIATTVLVTLYASSFLKRKSIMALFSGLMVCFYIFIFIIIQAEDFSLLIGSIGLFMIIGLLMYFSRNINWYGTRN